MLIVGMRALMQSSCLWCMLLGILDVSFVGRFLFDGWILSRDADVVAGPAMADHRLMHHTLGTGEFGYVVVQPSLRRSY